MSFFSRSKALFSGKLPKEDDLPSAGEDTGCWAIFGDIHANLEALTAVIADARAQGISRFACTGDLVGYGAEPSECLSLLQQLRAPIVLGNHDAYTATEVSLNEFSLMAMNALLWTREHLSADERAWLGGLPMERSVDGHFDLVHSGLVEPSKWHYVLKPNDARHSLEAQAVGCLFFGHTHVPSFYAMHRKTGQFEAEYPMADGTEVPLDADWKCLINPGSVGQPRDRDRRASYVIFDPAGAVRFRRVAYDIDAAAKKIIDAGLPEKNAQRLYKGK